MKYRDFSTEYPNDFECGLRAALNFTVMTSGMTAKRIAGELDVTASDLSRMIALIPSEEPHHRRAMPPGKVIELMLLSQNWSVLATVLGYTGFDPARLDLIRRDPASLKLLVNDIAAKVNEISVQLGMLGVQDRPLVRPQRRAKA